MNTEKVVHVEIHLKYCLRVYSGNTCIATGLVNDYDLPHYLKKEMAMPDFLSGKHRLEISALEKEMVIKY
jgi:hypothetical protein